MGFLNRVGMFLGFSRQQTLPPTPEIQKIDADLNTAFHDNKEIGIRAVASPNLAYRTHFTNSILGSRTGFENYDYNMTEIIQAEDTEAFLMAAFEEHIMTCLKAGWSIEGENKKLVEHVEKRLFEIYAATGISTDSLIRSIITNIVKFSNEYFVLVRQVPGQRRRTSGKPYKYKGEEHMPIVGIFSPDPVSMTVRRRKNGEPIQYKQCTSNTFSETSSFLEAGGQTKYFDASAVLHCAYKRKNGRAYGTPYVVPVLEDIRALRRLEEMTEILVSSHIFPLYHYIVGSEKIPGSDPEVIRTKEAVENTPTEGSIVTTERHKIEVIGAEGKALEIKDYLAYFEKRVLAGLRISEISLGRGDSSNRNTASSLDQVLIKRCEDVNFFISDFLTHNLIIELALDSGIMFSYDEMPYFVFKSIDEEAERAKENHNLNLYTSDGITEDELRSRNNWKPAPEGEADTRHVNRVAIHQAREEAKFAPKPAGTTSSSAKKSASNKSQPTNQHGKKATKTKTVKNSLDQALISELDLLTNIFDTLRDTDFVNKIAGNTLATSYDQMFVIIEEYAKLFSEKHSFDSANNKNIIADILKRRLHKSTVQAESFIKRGNTTGFIASLEDMANDLIGTGEEIESRLQKKEGK